jgi:hypothetical protein
VNIDQVVETKEETMRVNQIEVELTIRKLVQDPTDPDKTNIVDPDRVTVINRALTLAIENPEQKNNICLALNEVLRYILD